MKDKKKLSIDEYGDVSTAKKTKKIAESEEKLSMTRELKFKELQDKIDLEEVDRVVEEAIKTSKKKKSNKVDAKLEEEIDELLSMEKPKKEKKSKKEKTILDEDYNGEDISIKKVDTEDDLYLTTSFKPFKKRFRVKKLFDVLFSLICLIALVVVFIYFIGVPVYKMISESKPKYVFHEAIDYVRESSDKVLETLLSADNYSNHEIKFKIDSNTKELKDLSNYNFIFTQGVNEDNKTAEAGLFLEKNNIRYGYSLIENGSNKYYKYSTSDNYIQYTDELPGDLNLNNLLGIVENADNLNYEDFSKIIDIFSLMLKAEITDDMLDASKEVIDIDGVSINVTKYTLAFDKKKFVKFEKALSKRAANNKEFVRLCAKVSGKTEEEVKKELGTILDADVIKNDFDIAINIYMAKGNKFAGFDIEDKGFTNYSYYVHDGKIVAHLNLLQDVCQEGKNCIIDNLSIVDLVGKKENNTIKFQVSVNDEESGTLEFVELKANSMDANYSVYFDDILYEGDLYFNEVNNKVLFGFSADFNKEFIEIDVSITNNNDIADVGYVDQDKIILYTDKTFKKQLLTLEKELKNNNIFDEFNTWLTIFASTLNGDTEVNTDNIKEYH